MKNMILAAIAALSLGAGVAQAATASSAQQAAQQSSTYNPANSQFVGGGD